MTKLGAHEDRHRICTPPLFAGSSALRRRSSIFFRRLGTSPLATTATSSRQRRDILHCRSAPFLLPSTVSHPAARRGISISIIYERSDVESPWIAECFIATQSSPSKKHRASFFHRMITGVPLPRVDRSGHRTCPCEFGKWTTCQRRQSFGHLPRRRQIDQQGGA